MIKRALLWGFAAWSFLASPVWANTQAEEAMNALAAARHELQTVDTKADRVAALTKTIRALELGMTALRGEARSAAIREQALDQKLKSQQAEISKLFSVLQVMGRAPEPVMLFHPMGPTAAARSGMLLSDITPALQKKTNELRQSLDDIQKLREWQTEARRVLATSLNDLQDARVQLTRAISNRTELPARFEENQEKIQNLIDSARTLDEFASGLLASADPGLEKTDFDFATPVLGQVVRGFEQEDATGIARPGWLVATEPGALITAPSSGTIRYQGPLLDFGAAVVFEPYDGLLIIFAGMHLGYGKTGEVVTKGVPLGLMGGENSGGERTETLYMEVRNNQIPTDPILIFGQ